MRTTEDMLASVKQSLNILRNTVFNLAAQQNECFALISEIECYIKVHEKLAPTRRSSKTKES